MRYLDLLITSCVFSVPPNFLSSMAAAVRGGRPIVRTNKGRQRSLAFSQELCQRGRGRSRHASLFGMDLHRSFFSIQSHRSQSIIERDRLD